MSTTRPIGVSEAGTISSVNNTGSSDFIQGQDSVNQSGNSAGVQPNDNPFSMPGLSSGDQSVLGESTISLPESSSSQTQTTSLPQETYQPSEPPLLMIGLLVIFTIIGFILIAIGSRYRRRVAQGNAVEESFAEKPMKNKTTQKKSKKKKKPNHH